ncbi:acetylornithine deacetylase [Ktedonobacter racemifer]|uniref:Acetylornithine deacetylase (ArgE) n=1 Tax=Ktedonobacter racemifer DSM 44963 TaxID=485913 RepID=D6TSA9_KTERA|nr:acetylornithine deacetylase [Ktedonobacter racemifer]EFH83310.1 acetylornithine deacetylase (ArgE) [Ktedonobacter racemifer DSM 44963]
MTSLQQGELWELSRRLIGFNTVSALSNLEAAEYLASYLEESGLTVKVARDEIEGVTKASVIAWAGPAVEGGLIISGHIDVVPFEGQPGWKSDPLELITDGEKLYGRGVTDMKVFIAQAILAAKRQDLSKLRRPLMFILTYDEEVAGQGSQRLVKQLPSILQGFPLPRTALIGEPTNFEIFPAHKGYATFKISVRGQGGHSSAADRGLNAINRMSDVIQIIKETGLELKQQVTAENLRLFPENPSTAFNNGVIQGGLAANMIAETCELTTSMRVAPGDNVEQVIATLRERIEREISQEMRKAAPECGAWVSDAISVPPLNSPANDPFIEVLGRVMGQRSEHGAPYATDGGPFQAIGINSYICGPGLIEQAHQPNESLPVEHFHSGQERLERLIQAWCMQS